MGRKRKAGSLPAPLLPSSSISRTSFFNTRILETTAPQIKRSGNGSSGDGSGEITAEFIKKDLSRKTRRVQVHGTQSRVKPSKSSIVAAKTCRSSGDPESSLKTTMALDRETLDKASIRPTEPITASACHSLPSKYNIPGFDGTKKHLVYDKVGLMTPAQVLKDLVPRSGWRLGSCWGGDRCSCKIFDMAAPRSSKTVEVGEMRALCSCGHSPSAHELTDVQAEGSGVYSNPSLHPIVGDAPVRDGGNRSASTADTATEARRLRRVFCSIRNARALGDCGLFEDSEGVSSWGAGWFLTRLARQYLQEARQALAGLQRVLHDYAAVARCLATAEGLMMGNATGEWAVPNSLPSSSVYQALGAGVATELDRAYWHVRYTAASRFDAPSVTCSVPSVIPPPEVYFVCLASCLPLVRDFRAYLGRADATLRQKMTAVLDFPVEACARRDGEAGDCREIAFPVLMNPLLAVTQANWLEIAISARAESWVPHFPPQFGEPEGTMRGSDPALPRPIRAWCDVTRDWSARLFAFAVPNRRAVLACRKALEACRQSGGGVVEVGAGLGYWKWLLEGSVMNPASGGMSRGVGVSNVTEGGSRRGWKKYSPSPRQCSNTPETLRVLAFDQDPTRLPSSSGSGPHEVHDTSAGGSRGSRRHRRRSSGRGNPGSSRGRAGANEYHGGAPSWAQVEAGGPQVLRSLGVSGYPVLLLCYPPPSVTESSAAGSCMGADALEAFAGEVVLYVGEVGGDTGSPRMEALLERDWDLVDEVELPCFATTANRLMVLARKESTFSEVAQDPRDAGASVGDLSGVTSVAKPATTPISCRNPKQVAAVADTVPETESSRVDATLKAPGAGDDRYGTPLEMYRCTRCRRGAGDDVRLHMCRLTRAVSFCSDRCMGADIATWQANLRLRHIYLTPRREAQVAVDASLAYRDKKMFRKLAIKPSASRGTQ